MDLMKVINLLLIMETSYIDNRYRTGNETPVSVEKAVYEAIEEQLTMPDGIDFKVWNSLADAYRGRMALLLRNGLLGLTLVFILLSLFLEMRLAFGLCLEFLYLLLERLFS